MQFKYRDFFNTNDDLNIIKEELSEGKLTSDQEKEVVELYVVKLMSTLDIAKKYQVSKGTISNILKRYNVPLRNPSEKALTPKEEEDVVDLYDNQKMSSIEIANQYGVSSGTILRTLRKNNIKIRDFSLAKILSQTKKSKDYLRKYHNTRNISGQGTSGTQTFDAGTPDNIGPSRPIAKRLGGHSPTT